MSTMTDKMQPKTKRAARKVGFYGCNGHVVRLEVVARRAPRVVHLDECPGCKHGHKVHPFWRMWQKKLDAGKDALRISADG
jgi:hypothetical protein